MYMPSREARKYLHDIAEAIGYIAEFTAGRTYEEYRANPMLCYAFTPPKVHRVLPPAAREADQLSVSPEDQL